jgi:hypothetical protein
MQQKPTKKPNWLKAGLCLALLIIIIWAATRSVFWFLDAFDEFNSVPAEYYDEEGPVPTPEPDQTIPPEMLEDEFYDNADEVDGE